MLARKCAAMTAAALLLFSVDWPLSGSCFVGYDQSFIASKAPIIVVGEIVAIDTAKSQTRERNRQRYLDGARIKVEKIHKNILSDVTVREQGEIIAFMHSTNTAIPGSDKGGKQTAYTVSTDLSYPIGTRAVWFIFVNDNCMLTINSHPQQCLILKKDAAPPAPGDSGTTERTFSKMEWRMQGRSKLGRKK